MNILIYIIAYYYVLLSSINDGFSDFALGVPYAYFLLWEITDKRTKHNIKYLHSLVLITALVFILIDKSNLKIVYPIIGEKFTIVNDINYSNSNNKLNFIHFYPEYSSESTKIFLLHKGDIITVKRQIQLGHNVILTKGYLYEISSKRFKELREYITKVDTKKNKSFYIEDSNKFYTKDLFQFSRSQNIKMRRYPRFSNHFVYFSFYIFIYPIICSLFIFLIGIREKNSMQKKHNKS